MSGGDLSTADLFTEEPRLSSGSLQHSIELREVMSEALRTSQLTRYEVAAEMSRLLGVEITKAQLDAWTAESRSNWRFPFEYAAAFDAALGGHVLQDLLARKRGTRVARGPDSMLADLGRIEQMMRELRTLRQRIQQALKGLG